MNPIWSLAQKYKLRTFYSDYSNISNNIYHQDGGLLPQSVVARPYALATASSEYSPKLSKSLQQNERKRLFIMINELPTIFEVVTGAAKKQSKEKTTVTNNSSSKNKSGIKPRASESQAKPLKLLPPPKDEDDTLDEEEDDEHGDTLCGACGDNYASDEFWICCDMCEKWFHGKCVKITPTRAEHIQHYKCPTCSSNKRPRV